MKKNFFLVYLCFLATSLFSQTDISGYVVKEGSNKKPNVVKLVQIYDEVSSNKGKVKVIDSSQVDEKGYFHFSKTLPKYPQFYYLSLDGRRNKIRSKKFLLQNEDSIFFEKSDSFLSRYRSNSISNKEWQKLLIFENKIRRKTTFLDEIRMYSKDSLQILAVKLISIKELEKKQLLQKDIASNRTYYVAFLEELKESDINPQEYLFLELKLTQFEILTTEENYALSKWLNYILGFIILGMILFVYRVKNSKQKLVVLSKQELVIKELILQKKSNKEIASELFISVSTVKTHITNIYQKLQVVNRNDLMLKFKNTTGTST